MKFYLIDRNQEMVNAWKKEFNGLDDVEIICGDFFSKKVDCIVSPANSFGYMDGGLDLLISNKFGWKLQTEVQKTIKENYNGELLVGQAFIHTTYNKEIPWIIIAPTMRLPLFVPETVNAYLAARAIFLLLKSHNKSSEALDYFNIKNSLKINSVTMSGLCTGIGAMEYEVSARQMREAYDDFWLDKFQYPKTWIEAKHKHATLTGWKYNPQK